MWALYQGNLIYLNEIRPSWIIVIHMCVCEKGLSTHHIMYTHLEWDHLLPIQAYHPIVTPQMSHARAFYTIPNETHRCIRHDYWRHLTCSTRWKFPQPGPFRPNPPDHLPPLGLGVFTLSFHVYSLAWYTPPSSPVFLVKTSNMWWNIHTLFP